MNTNVFDNQNVLEHHGVKGQKWGIRRTPAQLGHRKKLSSGLDKARQLKKTALKAQNAKKKAERAESRALRRSKKFAIKTEKAAKTAAEKEARRREEILNSPSQLYKHRKEFSQQEIDAAIKRFQWERNLRDLSKSEMNVAKTYLDTAIGYAESGIKAYNTAAKIYNTMNKAKGIDKALPIIEGGGGKDKKQKKKQDGNDD